MVVCLICVINVRGNFFDLTVLTIWMLLTIKNITQEEEEEEPAVEVPTVPQNTDLSCI